MTDDFHRALALTNMDRDAQAVPFWRGHLAEEPHDSVAWCSLAGCLRRVGDLEAATKAAEQACSVAPDDALPHNELAMVLLCRDQLPEAERSINEAIRLEPTSAFFYSIAATIQLHRENWPKVLELSNAGLRCNPEHTFCANLRAQALLKLHDPAAAAATTLSALAVDPLDDYSHATRGWVLLQDDRTQEALTFFREALRLNPNSGWARLGLQRCEQDQE